MGREGVLRESVRVVLPLLMVFGKVGLLVVVFVDAPAAYGCGSDFYRGSRAASGAPSGCRESLLQNNFNVTPTLQLHQFRHTPLSFQGSWWYNIRRYQAQSSPSRRNGPRKSRQEYRHGFVL